MFSSKSRQRLLLERKMLENRKKLQLEIKTVERREFIEFKKIFTYKRLEECQEFLSNYISEHKKFISQPKETMADPSLLPELIFGFDAAKKTKSIISSARKTGKNELESVVKALKEIKEIAKDYEKSLAEWAKTKGRPFKSTLKNYFNNIFEKFNIDGENEFEDLNYFIIYEKEERLSLTP